MCALNYLRMEQEPSCKRVKTCEKSKLPQSSPQVEPEVVPKIMPMKRMYAPQLLCDLILKDKDQNEYHVHRAALASQSPVWLAAFEHSNFTSGSPECISLHESALVISCFLDFIYQKQNKVSNKLEDLGEMELLSLWKLVVQYQLDRPIVAKTVLHHVQKFSVSKDVMPHYLEFANHMKDKAITNACLCYLLTDCSMTKETWQALGPSLHEYIGWKLLINASHSLVLDIFGSSHS